MCKRPFKNKGQMNRFLLRRWNETITQKDTVYFLGDMSCGHNAKAASTWLKELNGNIIFINGNHDKYKLGKEYEIVNWAGIEFLLIHDPSPAKMPFTWNSWVIHGHKHNNDLENFPFINGITKTINLGVEVINYRPLSLKDLFTLNINEIKYMRTIEDKPVLFN
jgi:calcineurin-like phosphoesterase family protein